MKLKVSIPICIPSPSHFWAFPCWFQFFLSLALCVALCQSAVIRKNSRQKRTLGLLTAGANAVGAGLGAAGSAAATAFGVAASAKPLILLGLGKCEYLENDSNDALEAFELEH